MSFEDPSGKNNVHANKNAGKNPWGTPPERGSSGRNEPPNRGPWGSGSGGGGPRGGGPEQPDFDDFIARLQNGMKGFLPGGMDGGKFILLGAVAIAALWLASGFYIVQPGEHAVVQRFGAWTRTVTTEGLKYRLPAPVEQVSKFKVNEIQTLNIGFYRAGNRGRGEVVGNSQDIPEESLMLTSDRNIVDLDLTILWNIKSAEDYLFNIDNQENTIKKVSESAIREVVGQTPMFQVIATGREAVADNVKAIIQQMLDEYKSGVNITQILIKSAEVHPDVQPAFQDVQSAKQDAEDVKNRAQAYREDIIPKARGAATKIIQDAKGYEQSVLAKADGDAARFNSIYEAYQSGKDVTKERIYIETMESVLKNAQKIIMDNGKQGVVPYLPLNELSRTPATAAPKTEKR